MDNSVPNKTKTPVWELYNGRIAEMRREGQTLTPEKKGVMAIATKRWRANNPERARIIQEKAHKKYAEKKFASTWYRIVGSHPLAGKIVRAVSGRRGFLLLKDGTKIAVKNARIIYRRDSEHEND